MKKRILTVASAFLFLTITAFGFDKAQPSAKEVAIEGKYQKITVGANIKLVLIAANQKTVAVTGDQGRLQDITVKMSNNEMVITSKRSVKPGSVVVYVPATDLTYIDLKRGASVSNEGDLKFTDLTVFVNIDSRMELRIIRDIKVKQADDCDIVYERKETAKVVYVK